MSRDVSGPRTARPLEKGRRGSPARSGGACAGEHVAGTPLAGGGGPGSGPVHGGQLASLARLPGARSAPCLGSSTRGPREGGVAPRSVLAGVTGLTVGGSWSSVLYSSPYTEGLGCGNSCSCSSPTPTAASGGLQAPAHVGFGDSVEGRDCAVLGFLLNGFCHPAGTAQRDCPSRASPSCH